MTNAKTETSNPSGTLTTNNSSQESSPTSTSIEELMRDDAPLMALLSVRENPLLASATPEQLNALVLKLRMVAMTPAKQRSLLTEASGAAPKKRKPSAPSAQKLAQMKLLADLD